MLNFLFTFAIRMSRNTTIFTPFLMRKLATVLLISVSVAAFATLGDGGKRSTSVKEQNLLTLRSVPLNYKNFSLKSGYRFRNSFLTPASSEKVIMLNTVITYQKGNTTYILPLKKKLLLGKVTFQPTQPQR